MLLDEIEKAKDTLWQLLLGILDKGNLIVMTSDLGAVEMGRLISGPIGFVLSAGIASGDDVVVDCPAHAETLAFSKTLEVQPLAASVSV